MPPAPVPKQPLAPPPNQQNQTQQKYLTLAGITQSEKKPGAMGVTIHAKKKEGVDFLLLIRLKMIQIGLANKTPY